MVPVGYGSLWVTVRQQKFAIEAFRKPMLYPAELRGLNDLRDFLRAGLQPGYSHLMGYNEPAR